MVLVTAEKEMASFMQKWPPVTRTAGILAYCMLA